MAAPELFTPRGFDTWNRAMRGAYRKGQLVCNSGGSIDDCPYTDKRKDCGRLTWSRAFRSAWLDGFTEQTKFNAITDFWADRA